MSRLPAVLGTADLPLAELCAARLDGELMPLGGGWSPVDEPDQIASRALAIAMLAPRGLVISRFSAAWVHGAIASPPAVPQFCRPISARSTSALEPYLQVQEIALADEDLVVIGTVGCTAVDRTAFDLARDPTADETEAVDAIAGCIRLGPAAARAITARLTAARSLPHVALARRRYAAALARLHGPGDQPSLTR